jgi:hypothetical protein
MAIEKIGPTNMAKGTMATMKEAGYEIAKSEAQKTEQTRVVKDVKEENKGFKIDTKA